LNFIETVQALSRKNESLLCVGLDPDPDRFPEQFRGQSDAIFQFNRAIVDATSDLVCAYKPQIAFYAAAAAEQQLQASIDYIHDTYQIPVILDAKRGDIGSTATMYAREVFERYQADAATINPYLGLDSMQPFLDYREKGVLILCRTSNPGGAELQNLKFAEGQTLYEEIAHRASKQWNQNHNVLLVVGATQPGELARIRAIVGDMTLLLPGVGVQGADLSAMMVSARGGGVIVSASRSILYAGSDDQFADQARRAAMTLRDQINGLSEKN
jgi:orotidine-5'-phosphate decarboxylase|tara:strand:+ start:485 stop:1297 length:813 start_codon:yes stop_codon:yes gene_type:complete